MRLNSIKPGEGAKHYPKRVGRGIGSGLGKTGGRGHKGLKSRSGGSVKPGFEGGQMPLQRRLPKFGFSSRKSLFSEEIRLSELHKVGTEIVDMESLRKAGLITSNTKYVKIFKSGDVSKAFTVKGIRVTKGAKAAIEAAGGKIDE